MMFWWHDPKLQGVVNLIVACLILCTFAIIPYNLCHISLAKTKFQSMQVQNFTRSWIQRSNTVNEHWSYSNKHCYSYLWIHLVWTDIAARIFNQYLTLTTENLRPDLIHADTYNVICTRCDYHSSAYSCITICWNYVITLYLTQEHYLLRWCAELIMFAVLWVYPWKMNYPFP